MSHKITIEGGSSVRLPTAGKYCDRDIVITAEGGKEDLDDVLTEQEQLLEELVEALDEKIEGTEAEYETWTIAYADGTIEEKKVKLV